MNEDSGALSEWELQQWQRLSPWSVLYFIGSTLRSLLDPNVLIMLAPAYGLYQLVDNTFYFVLLAVLGVPGLIVGSAVLQYLFFHFRVVDNNFQIRRGMMFKRRLDLPVGRIQDVSISIPFYFKPLGLVSATLDTAGSSENEAVLAAVSARFADALRQWVLSGTTDSASLPGSCLNQINHPSQALSDDQVGSTVILTRTIMDLVIHGITNNKVWIILAAIFPLLDRLVQRAWHSLSEEQAPALSALLQTNLQENAFYAYGLIAAIALAVIMLMLTLSILGSVFILYGFEVRKQGNALSRESGLFSRNQINLKVRRVQYLHVKQGLADRLFRRFNLIYRQLDIDHPGDRHSNSAFLVPSVTSEEVEHLTGILYPDNGFVPGQSDQQLQAISTRYILQLFLTRTLPLTMLVILVMAANNANNYIPGVAGLLIFLGSALNLLQWHRWGYCQSEDYLILRMGLFGSNYLVIPRFKVQQVGLSQSYLMARNQHCHLSFVIGLNGIKVPYIPLKDAMELADRTLYDIESTHRSWM